MANTLITFDQAMNEMKEFIFGAIKRIEIEEETDRINTDCDLPLMRKEVYQVSM